jgi:DNA mismatch repair protein MutS2
MTGPFLGAELGADVPEADLHGLSRSEAAHEIERLIQGAFMRSERVVRIVHGRGDGILRELVKETLERHPNVRSYMMGSGASFAEIERK